MNDKTKNYIRIGILFFLLLLPSFYAMFTALDLEYSWLKKIAFLVVVIVCLLIPALFLKARTYFIVEGIFNFLFCPIDIASLYLNGQSTSAPFLRNILLTDRNEALELLASLWPICVAVVVLWILYFFLAARVKNEWLLGKKARRVLYIALASLTVFGFVAMLGLQKYMYPTKSTKLLLIDAVDSMRSKFYKIYPYNLYLELNDLAKMHREQVQLQKEVSSYRFGIKQQENLPNALYIVVIGETARYDHLGLNGYERNTTPLLEQKTHLISYDSLYTQANLTGYSVPMMLTRATADCQEISFKEKSLPEAFQEAGYRAGFISKQNPSLFTGRVLRECDYAYQFPLTMDVDGNYDEEIIDKLREYIVDTPQMFVFHTMGSHFRYERRYPQEFAQFQPTLGKNFSYSMVSKENKELLVNSYDNSLLYTDYFLSQLIDYMDSLDRPAVMLYLSDHGESFWDDENNLSLHGGYLLSEYEYHIPMLIWYSDEYERANPEKVKAIQQNKKTPVSTAVIFYSMLDIANIEDIVDSTRSIASFSLLPMDTIWVQKGTGEMERMALH